MSKKSGFGKLLLGIGAGIGLGFLFAPEKGSETRKALKVKLDELVAKVKELDPNEVKESIENKIEEIRYEIKDLDKEKVLAIAKEKSEDIKDKIEDLYALTKEKATPVVEEAVLALKESAIKVTKSVLKKLENEDKE